MKTLFSLALLGLLATAFVWERSAMDGLRAQNEALRAEQQKAGQLADDNRDLQALRAAAAPAQRSDRTELLRLRNEIRRLRAQQQEAEKLRAANQRLAEEIKSGKFAPRRLADLEGAVPREKWSFAGFATPESAVQSLFAALVSGDLEQLCRCVPPEEAEAMRQDVATDPQQTRKQMEKFRAMFSAVSGYRIVEKRNESDDRLEVAVQCVVDGEPTPLKFRRIGAEWKFDN